MVVIGGCSHRSTCCSRLDVIELDGIRYSGARTKGTSVTFGLCDCIRRVHGWVPAEPDTQGAASSQPSFV